MDEIKGSIRQMRPGVAIVRGPNLNKWEMQNYEPLMDRFDLTAYTTSKHNFTLDDVRIPVVQLDPQPQNPAGMQGLEEHMMNEDVIFTADITWIFTYQAVLAKKTYGCKVVALEWENIPFAYEEHEGMKELKAINKRFIDIFVAVTERAKEALMIEGVPGDKIVVIPMGIDITKFRPDEGLRAKMRRRLNIPENEKVVLFTGRLVWEKGIYDLLYAAKLICLDKNLKDFPVRFVVTGNGPEASGVKERVIELGMSNIFTFIESCPYHEMPDMFNMADVFVLPSISTRTWKEQFGMVLIEAMACGLPVISTLSGSIPEVVGDAGLLTQPNDPEDLCRAIKRLLEDNEIRKVLGKKGRDRAVSEFDSREISKKFANVFDEAYRSTYNGAVRELALYSGLDPEDVMVRVDNVTSQQTKEWGRLSDGGLTEDKVIDFYRNTDSYLFDLIQYNYKNPLYHMGITAIADLCRTVVSERGEVSVLDFGGGIGSQLINLSGIKGLKLADADIPGKTFDYAKWRFEHRGIDVEMIDAGSVDFLSSKSFDMIIMLDVVEHLVDPEKTCLYLIGHLRPNGYLIMNASFNDNNGEHGWHLNTDKYSNDGFYQIISKMGMEMLNKDPLRFFRKVFDDSMEDLKGLIELSVQQGRLSDAREHIESYLELHPADMDMICRHAEICFKSGLADEAVESLERVLLFEPGRKEAAALMNAIKANAK
ncbi:MAG: glycosyltransferase [Nitrospirae bacterium]|nr:glycosyltransferase [Nitrospirota bacterium]